MERIPFNKPYLSGKELYYISKTIHDGRAAGNQTFTKKSQAFFESKYGFSKTLLTTSCTDALELGSLLLDIREGDEIILPSYTFVSTANPFILRGAKLVFVDSNQLNPNIDCDAIEPLITNRTKAIVVVHYGGVACDMARLKELTERYGLFLVEDAAQAIDSFYHGRALGSFGDVAAFSFHETKNIICGEGGMLVINNEKFQQRSEILWEKGTNRSAFFRGEINKYEWVDVGSSFLPSDILSAFLYAQLENLEDIQQARLLKWERYNDGLATLEEQYDVKRPHLPDYATKNGHLFYLVCRSLDERTKLIDYLKDKQIQAVFHYLSLHDSPYFRSQHDGRDLVFCKEYTDRLVRLPLYYELTSGQQDYVIDSILHFYRSNI
ncbi:MAG: dTDP-4-amino-4,6-dideoxygalactose transaminase [Saprospiraceae bacterium]|nr:dTDP-4-amino-4,6-dideoxygalactose transaminase [Saprospiraceae bacterium]